MISFAPFFEGFLSNLSDVSKAVGKTAVTMAPDYIDVAGRVIGGAFNVGRVNGGTVTGSYELDRHIRRGASAGRMLSKMVKDFKNVK